MTMRRLLATDSLFLHQLNRHSIGIIAVDSDQLQRFHLDAIVAARHF